MAAPELLPPDVIVFGPSGNCTLALCPLSYSVYRYRPSLPANITFIALYVLAAALHLFLGLRWRQFAFMWFMLAGCAVEVVGYVGRVIMYGNPFDFGGFMIQIVFITSGPVFYTAAIYITLSKTIAHYSPAISRLKPPKLYYWIFLPADLLCLSLQAAGGALSTTSSGSSQIGIDLALAGLSLQVVVIVAFLALFADHMARYFLLARRGAEGFPPIPARMYVFVGALYGATVLILARCAFRCYELKDGYSGGAVADEGLFIGLEGVLVVLAVFTLGVGHPGLLAGRRGEGAEKGSASSSEA